MGGLINSISLEMATLERGGGSDHAKKTLENPGKPLKTFENPQAAKILSLNFHIAIQIQDITSSSPPIAERMKSYKHLQK